MINNSLDTEDDMEKFIAENSDKDVSEIAIWDVEEADQYFCTFVR